MASVIYKGRDLRISAEGKTLYHATNCTMDSTLAIEAVATKDTDGEEGTPSNISWSVSADALFANAPSGSSTTQGAKDIIDLHLNKTRVTLELTTDDTGDILITGEAYIESWNMGAPVGGNATFSATFKGMGIYTTALVA